MDHVGIAVDNLEAALAFYDAALAPLGIRRLMSYGGDGKVPDHVGYGSDVKPYFWLGRGDAARGYVHLAFPAPDRHAVDSFYQAALDAGARDNGAPGLRPHYHPGYYGAFVLAPDGCNVEAVHHSFS
ncbi:VOC family protein [Rhizobium rhizosphaerae]|uniref:VOC family protein n=1 Tax=Xaviernesmea rhizosphaerae TaxID=1672749 RepID=UPI00094FC617|nr:VOC family protein [Xaviernesmea rhizosphaerae]